MKPGSKVLYIGAASGTTVSHVSDLVGPEGAVYAVEFSKRVGRDLVTPHLAKELQRCLPLLALFASTDRGIVVNGVQLAIVQHDRAEGAERLGLLAPAVSDLWPHVEVICLYGSLVAVPPLRPLV